MQININDFFDTIEIEKVIFKLVKDGKFIPKKLIAREESTNRIKSTVSQSSQDNIKDDGLYDDCENNKAVRQVGVEWAIQQSKELKEAGVPVLHYYSMGKSDNIRTIASKLF